MLARSLLCSLCDCNRSAGSALRMIDFLRSRYAPFWSFTQIEPSPMEDLPIPVPALTNDSGGSSPEDYLSFLTSMPTDGQHWHGLPDTRTDDTWLDLSSNVFEAGTMEWQKTLDALLQSTPGV